MAAADKGTSTRSHTRSSLLSDPVRWRRAVDLFHAALERPAEGRDAFLSEACGADTDLRREVASLMDADRQASQSGLEGLGGELAAGWIRECQGPDLVGKTLGRYEVAARVGSGGMGDVYRASDRTLGRSVALKVLSPAFLADPGFRRRLEDEARAASSLNHPNIVTVYEIGHAEDVDFIASEFVDGGTLRELMSRGTLELTQIVDIALQVAAALSAAHASGLIHRDIKPENVMLRRDGIVKLVDFGLAKLAPPGETAALSTLTRTGAVQGTVCYMSPEQALQSPLDHRSDLFSFGIVIYEMATGQRPFDGASDAARYDALLNTSPGAPTTLRPTLPAGLDLVIDRALEKDPELRYQSATDLAADLKRLQRPTTTSAAAARRAPARRAMPVWPVAAIVGVAAIVAIAAATIAVRRESPETRVVRSIVPPPAGALFTLTGTLVPSVTFALSLDGRQLAFLAEYPGARARLWVRPLDTVDPTPLAGTEGATYPFWSPDGRSLGFFADGSLKRIDIDGGTPLTLVEKIEGRGGAWSRDDVILFGSSEGPIYRVAAAGGPAQPVTALDSAAGETWHRFPQLLPDRKRFLYLARDGDNVRRLFAGSLDDTVFKSAILEANAKAAYVDPGYLLYVTEGTLMARPFDTRALALTGQPVQVARKVAISSANDAAFAVSDAGVLMYSERVSTPGQLTWFDRAGQPAGTLGSADEFLGLRLSPDAKTVAVTRVDPSVNMPDLWMLDVDRGVFSRFTDDPWLDVSPIWSADGRRMIFSSSRQGRLQLFEQPIGGGTSAQLLAHTAFSVYPDDVTKDGRFMVYSTDQSAGRFDIGLMRLADLQASPLLATRFNESQARVSADGRWMAYASDETGRDEIFVREFPAGKMSVQVSSEGGGEPAWRGDGKELYFLSPADQIMSVSINATGPRLEAGAPTTVFQVRTAGARLPYLTHYAASADGHRFLVNAATGASTTPTISVVTNWTSLAAR